MADARNPLEGLTSADLGYSEGPTRDEQRRPTAPSRMSREDSSRALSGLTSKDLGYSEQPAVTPGGDLARSVISGAQNIPIGIVGLPGTVSDLLRTGVGKGVEKGEELLTRGYNWARGESGSPEGDLRLQQMKERQQAGRELIGQQPRFPTAHDIASFVQPGAEAVGVPGPLYEPETKTGKFGKTMTEFAGPGLLGKAKATGAIVGAITGAGSEASGQAVAGLGGGPEAEAAARILSALAVGRYAPSMVQTGRNIMSPGKEAEQQLAREIASARAAGKAPSDADVQTALAEVRQRGSAGTPGEQLVAYDLLGQRGARTAERGLSTQEGRAAAEMVDDFLKARQADTARRLDAVFDSIHGKPIQTEARRASMQSGIDVDNPVLFNAARVSKEGRDVASNVTRSLRKDPLAAEAIKAASRTFRGSTPDNLAFWHEVKTNLDYMVDRAFKNNDGLLGRQLQTVRDTLRNDLRSTVPKYGDALDAASGFFKGKNAIDSGVKFAEGRYTLPELQDARRAYMKYGPDQKAQFEEAYLYQLRENAKSATGSSIIPNLAAEREKMAALFGPQKAERLYSVAVAEDVMNLKKVIDFNKAIYAPGMGSGVFESMLAPGASYGAVSALLINPTTGGLAGAAASGAAAIRKLALNAEERAVAGRVNRLLASEDPLQIARLSKLAEQNKAVNSVLDKYKQAMIVLIQAGPSASRAKERKERKAGGRVMSSQAILAAAERAKKEISGATKALLNSSDEHVAKALEIAKQNLEG